MIVDAGINIIRADGWDAVTRKTISDTANIGLGTVNHAFGSMDKLRDELIRYAIKNAKEPAMLKAIATSLVQGNEVAKSAADKIKRAALATLY